MADKRTEIVNNNLMINYKQTDNILSDMQNIIETSQKVAHSSVNTLLVQRNWLIGYRIVEELSNSERAEYGLNVMKNLSKKLSELYGKGYTKTNL